MQLFDFVLGILNLILFFIWDIFICLHWKFVLVLQPLDDDEKYVIVLLSKILELSLLFNLSFIYRVFVQLLSKVVL
jgi:hypothetical protein